MRDCPDCHGAGQRRVFNAKAPTSLPDLATCPTCHGTGHFADEPVGCTTPSRSGVESGGGQFVLVDQPSQPIVTEDRLNSARWLGGVSAGQGCPQLERAVRTTRTPAARSTVSQEAGNWAARSRRRRVGRRSASSSGQARFRACGVTQAAEGCSVQPATNTRRVWSSMKNSTHNVCRRTVSTVKQSPASTPGV